MKTYRASAEAARGQEVRELTTILRTGPPFGGPRWRPGPNDKRITFAMPDDKLDEMGSVLSAIHDGSPLPKGWTLTEVKPRSVKRKKR